MVRCDQCRRTKNISHRNEMAQQPILEIELFNVWGINFMGFLYLVAIFTSCWPLTMSQKGLKPYAKNDAVIVNRIFKRNIFSWFRTLTALINDEGSWLN